MKALVISDIHGSGYYADKIREIVERENPEKIILLGDLYYHGPRNDLSQEYNPTKVSRSALQNAASVASMILTTESIVTDKKEPKACGCGDHNDGAGDMGGMY